MKKYITTILITALTIVEMITLKKCDIVLLFIPYGIYRLVKDGPDF